MDPYSCPCIILIITQASIPHSLLSTRKISREVRMHVINARRSMRLCVHLEYFQREAGSLSQQDSQLSENEDVKGQEFFLSQNAKEPLP